MDESLDMEKRVSLTIRMPLSKRRELEELSDKTGHEISSIVRGLLYARLEEEKRKEVAA